ncbi:uncharacterized protein K452DRAFT_224410 [Aplosporella prunicola CBS 121167]|uniref:Sodium/calcium exchanger membrane region domain-containing protein n=1 Tax=Aplosporella prunicola CBS 121167 TaxID=1176127 RepID=A0A6A6BLF5_9PEZI|nr:uncharacterized protein K452DRAFT_224410 [Aplosporella prunicola CBS 121167]KAF2143697.1 hypothetical protein K452DRAFT_224410 [Aplosporella prunicola CBS 121167]
MPTQSASDSYSPLNNQTNQPPVKEPSVDTDPTLVGGRRRKVNTGLDGKNDTTNVEQPSLERKASTRSKKSTKSKNRPPITPWSQFKHVVFGSWVNLLLVMVPAGFAVNYAHINGVAVFVINFIAIIPLAGMLGYSTEELALHVGETLGGLLNASFGNAVELIVGIQALVKGELTIVKTSLIGSMLSNLLLVMGMSFFLGGINRLEQHFNITVAQTAASLLALAVASLIIPTVFHMWVEADVPDLVDTDALSRGTSVILLFVYACYLIFQLKTHAVMYNEPSQKGEKRPSSKLEPGATNLGLARIGANTAATAGGQVNQANLVHRGDLEEEEDEEEIPVLTVWGALVSLAISTILVAFCSEFMVDNISEVAGEGKGLSQTFLGLILLPIVGNAAEHATAVTVAMKDKMDLAIGVAVGSSMQIALLVLPLVVIIGWIIGQDAMNLSFDGFQIAVLFVAVLLVNYLIGDGKSHWLEGMLLMTTYTIIAVAAFVYPD